MLPEKVSGTDIEGKIQVDLQFNSKITFGLFIDYNFLFQVDTVTYYGFHSLMSTLGGYNASWAPLLALSAPLFILNFFYKLAQVIKNKYIKAYRDKLKELHIKYINSSLDVNVDSDLAEVQIEENLTEIFTKLNEKYKDN